MAGEWLDRHLQAFANAVRAEIRALESQIDRLQRGNTIESDFITKRETELMQQSDELAETRSQLREISDAVGKINEAIAELPESDRKGGAWDVIRKLAKDREELQRRIYGNQTRADGYESLLIGIYNDYDEAEVKKWCSKAVHEAWLEGARIVERDKDKPVSVVTICKKCQKASFGLICEFCGGPQSPRE